MPRDRLEVGEVCSLVDLPPITAYELIDLNSLAHTGTTTGQRSLPLRPRAVSNRASSNLGRFLKSCGPA